MLKAIIITLVTAISINAAMAANLCVESTELTEVMTSRIINQIDGKQGVAQEELVNNTGLGSIYWHINEYIKWRLDLSEVSKNNVEKMLTITNTRIVTLENSTEVLYDFENIYSVVHIEVKNGEVVEYFIQD